MLCSPKRMQRLQLQGKKFFCGYLREIIKETRERKRANSHSTLAAVVHCSHPPPVTILLLLLYCAIKIYDANKQRRYHAKSAFHEWICSYDARQLLMDVNHRRINNLSNVFIAAAFAFFLPFFFSLNNFVRRFMWTNFFFRLWWSNEGKLFIAVCCRSSKLQIHLKTIWIRMQHQIEWWSGVDSVGETQTDAVVLEHFLLLFCRSESIKN